MRISQVGLYSYTKQISRAIGTGYLQFTVISFALAKRYE